MPKRLAEGPTELRQAVYASDVALRPACHRIHGVENQRCNSRLEKSCAASGGLPLGIRIADGDCR